MKKRLIQFLLICLYVGLVAALLLTHIRLIAMPAQRMMAMIETLLLIFPTIIILILYLRMQQKETAAQPEEKNTAAEEKSKAVDLEQFEVYSRDWRLSAREIEVVWLLYRGYTNRQIAEELYIAESTVKKHVSHVYEKMLVSSRKEWKEKVNREIKK